MDAPVRTSAAPKARMYAPPLSVSAALDLAGALYRRNLIPMLSLYLLFMALPMGQQLYLFATFATEDFARTDKTGQIIDAVLATIPAGDPHYFSAAFARLFGAIITPFALASIILAIKNLISWGKPRPRNCLSAVGRKWLALAQFGLLMHIVSYSASALLRAVDDFSASHSMSAPEVLVTLGAVAVGYVVMNLGYCAALVVVTLDRVDPIRGFCFGMWFALRYAFESLGRLAALVALAVMAFFLIVYTCLAINSSIALTAGLELATVVFSSWVDVGLVLFVLDRLARSGYRNAPPWLRLS